MAKSVFNTTSGDGKIKSAKEMGFKAESLGIIKKKKSHKGRKIIEDREAKIVENPKKSILVKGNKTSQMITELIKDLHTLRGQDMSKLFMRKAHDIHPFEDIGPLEQMANKQDCSLFVLGSHQKKRPDNLIVGRNFAEHLLDMFEFGVSNYKGISQYSSDMDCQIKPILVFQGEQFEFSEKHSRFKNWAIDFFKFSDYEEANIAELKRVMIFTSVNDTKIQVRHYEMKNINETDVKKQSLDMSEIGPSFDLSFRRDKIAASELYKAACKQPKAQSAETKRLNKNVFTDEFGQVKAKVFVQQ
jgi:ribosome production factor 2